MCHFLTHAAQQNLIEESKKLGLGDEIALDG
jgi:hypothetical protein